LFEVGNDMAAEKVVDAAGIAEPVINDMGHELADVKFVTKKRSCLRFFIDKEGGVGINDCQAVSREIDTLIEVENIIKGSYVLEVSSPGLDRPLYKPSDYIRFEGSLAKVRTREPLDGQKVFLGRIDSAGEEGFNIITENGKVYGISYSQVEKARLEVEF
jgi:ribosome maturation factor RimP